MTKDGKRHEQQKQMQKRADTNTLENEAHSLVQIRRSIKKKSKSQSSVLYQPRNTEAAAGLEAILLVFQVFPRAPKKVGVASVESMEPHWRLEVIMGSSLMGRLACLRNVCSSWGADSYEWQVT